MASANETSDHSVSDKSNMLDWNSYFPKSPYFSNAEQRGKQKSYWKRKNKFWKNNLRDGGYINDEDLIIMRLVRDAREIVIDRKIEEIQKINREIERRYAEVEKDKRAAESQSTHVDEDEPSEQDKEANNSTSGDSRRDDHLQGDDSNDKNYNRGRGGNRRSFWSRGGRGHFKQPHRGGQHQRNSDDGHHEESGHHKTRAHFHGHQRSRGAKFLTVSAASSSRDVQFGNGDQLLIKVDLSQSTLATSGQHQSRQNNHHHQHQQQQQHKLPSTNEGEGEHSNVHRGSDHRPQGRNGRGSEVRFISTGQSEGNRQEFPPDHKTDHHHHHHHHQFPPGRGFDHHRRGFRPPRRNGGGRWQRGFLPPRDFGEAREEAFRGMRGFRGPRGGRVFRRRGQNPHGKGFGPLNRDLEVNPQEKARNEAPAAEDLEPGIQEGPENEANSQSVEEGEIGGGGDGSEDLEEDAEVYQDSEDTTRAELDGNPEEKLQAEEKTSTEQGQIISSKSPKDEEIATLEIDKNLADNFSSAVALGGTESKVEASPSDASPKKHETIDMEVAPKASPDSTGGASSSSPTKAEASVREMDSTPGGNDRPQDSASDAGDQKKLPKGEEGSETCDAKALEN